MSGSLRTVFVSVGATSTFDPLLSAVLKDSTIKALRDKGFTRLEIQCGATQLPELVHVSSVADGTAWNATRAGIELAVWAFKPSLAQDFASADLIISHAGSGTIVDVLRLGKPLLVVPNPALLHNHQEELARALHDRGYLVSCHVTDLATTISRTDFTSVTPFPAFDGSKVQALLDEEMGFV